jgi:hypothetical protein
MRTSLIITSAAVGVIALSGGSAYAATALTGHNARPAAATVPALQHSMAKPKAGQPQPRPARPAPASYSRHIASAGIQCHHANIDSVGQEVVAYWQAGYSAQWTNVNILMPVGIYQFNTFNNITVQDFQVTLPAGGIQPASNQPPATPAPTTPPATPPTTTPTPPTTDQPTPPAPTPTQPTQDPTTPAPDPSTTTPAPSPLDTWWNGSGQSDTQSVQTALTTVQNDITGYQGGQGTVTLAAIQADAATLLSAAQTANGSGAPSDVPGYTTAMDDLAQAAQDLANGTDGSAVTAASPLLTDSAAALQQATSYIQSNLSASTGSSSPAATS